METTEQKETVKKAPKRKTAKKTNKRVESVKTSLKNGSGFMKRNWKKVNGIVVLVVACVAGGYYASK